MKRKILTAVSVFIFGGILALQSYAYIPYDSYTYSTQTGKAAAQYCPTPYYPVYSIDKSTIGVPLSTISSMCFDKEGNLYFTDSTNNRVIILDKNYKKKAVIESFDNSDGMPDFLGGPEGIFVTDDMNIYVCDTKQSRILVFDKNLKFVKKYEKIKPINDTGTDEYMFMPSKIVVDSANNMYVLVQNEYQGIMQLDKDGKFISFIGGNKVTYDPITMMWKKIMSKEQKKQLDQFLPVEYTNISLDNEGFIYTVSKAKNSSPIKRLNLAGKDVLIRNGYVDLVGDIVTETADSKTIQGSLFVDIASDKNGMIYALDANKGRIFVYNNEGFLFYVFGSMGTQLGTFVMPSAIEVNGDDILVADQGNQRITVFRRTRYADLISAADQAYNKGHYDESLENWKGVISLNSNFELAYAQMGKIYLRRNEFKKALDYFELGNFRGDRVTATTGYNKAFTEYRRTIAAQWLGPVVILIVLAVAGRITYKAVRRKRYEGKN